jgi:hypothetical protein
VKYIAYVWVTDGTDEDLLTREMPLLPFPPYPGLKFHGIWLDGDGEWTVKDVEVNLTVGEIHVLFADRDFIIDDQSWINTGA